MVENAFGIAAVRWRILLKPILASEQTLDSVVKAVVCLHNFLMAERSYCPPTFIDRETRTGFCEEGDWRLELEDDSPFLKSGGRLGGNRSCTSAQDIRNAFSDYFFDKGSVSWQLNYVRRGFQRNM